MSRSRFLALVLGLLVATLGLQLTGISGSTASTASTSGTRVAAKVPAPPKAGSCRSYGFKVAMHGVADPSKAVPCGKDHTARVIKVGHLVKGTMWKSVTGAANQARVTQTCLPAFTKVVGGSYAKRDRTAYTFDWFAPTRAQFKAGARWFRCDVILVGKARLLTLPTNDVPFLAGAQLTGKIVRCFDSATGRMYSCASPHDYRSKGTFAMTGSTYPTAKAFRRASTATCPDITGDDDWASTWASKVAWKHGDHVVVCYAAD